MFIGPCIIAIVDEWKTNLMSLAILFHLLCAQYVSDINISIFSLKLLKMDILMSETCWAHNKWNKIASDIKLVFHSSTYYIFWVSACSLRYPACNARAPYCHLWPVWLYNICPHYLINGTIFEKKKKLLNTKCVLWSLQICLKYFSF